MTTGTLGLRGAAEWSTGRRAGLAPQLGRRAAERVALPVLLLGLLVCVAGYLALAFALVRTALLLLP